MINWLLLHLFLPLSSESKVVRKVYSTELPTLGGAAVWAKVYVLGLRLTWRINVAVVDIVSDDVVNNRVDVIHVGTDHVSIAVCVYSLDLSRP